MAKMPAEVMNALADPMALKMVATVDSRGIPNAVVIGTVLPVDEETIGFGVLFMKKTKANLNDTKRFSVAVLKSPMEAYQIKCTFQGFQESGQLMETLGYMVYNMLKMSVKGVGTGKVEEVYSLSINNPGQKIA